MTATTLGADFLKPWPHRPVAAADARPVAMSPRQRRTTDGRLVLKAVRPNAGVEAAYRAAIERLIDEMHRSVAYWLAAAYRRGEDRIEAGGMAQDALPSIDLRDTIRRLRLRWTRRFREASKDLAEYFAKAAYRRSDDELPPDCNARCRIEDRPGIETSPAVEEARYEFRVSSLSLPVFPERSARPPHRATPDFWDGKIKVPPAAGVHVVGWIGFSCRLPPMPCWRST